MRPSRLQARWLRSARVRIGSFATKPAGPTCHLMSALLPERRTFQLLTQHHSGEAATARHRLEKALRRPACIAAESLKTRHPPMVDNPKPIKSRASPMRGGSTAVSSPENSATCSASVALVSGSDSVRDSILACPSMALVSLANSRVLGAGDVSDGLTSRTTSVILSGLNIPAGPNHCGGSMGVVRGVVAIGSSAWASASDVWAASVCRWRSGGEEEASDRGDPVWLTCWPLSPKYQHLRL
jgi:hypothetical protein